MYTDSIYDTDGSRRQRAEAGRPMVEADDLTAIRGIDRSIAARLHEMGIYRFRQIADWDRSAVREAAELLGLGRAISKQNWIEQAAVLALVRATAHPAVETPRPAEPEPPVATASVVIDPTQPSLEPAGGPLAPTPPAEPPLAAEAADHYALSDICGLSQPEADLLAAGGVMSVGQIAAWSAGDVAWWKGILGPASQIEKDNWIAQAAVLASGRPTQYVLDGRAAPALLSAGEPEPGYASLWRLPEPEPQPSQPAAGLPRSSLPTRLRTLRIEPNHGPKGPRVRVRVMPRRVPTTPLPAETLAPLRRPVASEPVAETAANGSASVEIPLVDATSALPPASQPDSTPSFVIELAAASAEHPSPARDVPEGPPRARPPRPQFDRSSYHAYYGRPEEAAVIIMQAPEVARPMPPPLHARSSANSGKLTGFARLLRGLAGRRTD